MWREGGAGAGGEMMEGRSRNHLYNPRQLQESADNIDEEEGVLNRSLAQFRRGPGENMFLGGMGIAGMDLNFSGLRRFSS